ncbi:MAG: glycoside hydrolase family 3 C-terminal domain-containing protein [Oscillospiraceae bacterium]|nr:glycoside hydrolase family 3 C-terminal domain-containing protein [Oscillospiraceae bacterium]
MDAKKKTIAGGDEYTEQAVRAFMESGAHQGYVNPDPPAPVAESATAVFPDEYPRALIYPISEAEIDAKVEALVKTMTFREKCDMLYVDGALDPADKGGTTMYGVGVPRLGVPVMRQHDGPPGIRARYETTSPPEPLLLGCTFDPKAAYDIGTMYAEELKSIGSNMKLGAQLDVGRSPSWHRLKDIYGEDYYLVSEMGVAEVRGVQEHGGMTMGKHMGAYNTVGDTLQTAMVDEQTLHTAYLQPFERACREAKLSSIMTSYNTLNGYFTASNKYMQIDVARDMWGWKGNFTTDAGGNREMSVGLGTDVEMGLRFNTMENIRAYLRKGLITMSDVDNCVRHALWTYGICGYLNLVEIDPDTGLAKDEPGRTKVIELTDTYLQDRAAGLYRQHNEVVTRAAEQGITLLKNENGALPLKRSETIALIGYPAKYHHTGVGMERSFGMLEYMTTPTEALRQLWPEATILSEPYEDPFGEEIPADVIFQRPDCGESGWIRTNGIRVEDAHPLRGFDAGFGPPKEPEAVDMPGFETGSFAGVDRQIAFRTGNKTYWNGRNGTALKNGQAYTWTGYLKAPMDGEYQFIIEYIGGSASVTVFDGAEEKATCGGTSRPGMNYQWAYFSSTNDGTTTANCKVMLEAGKIYKLVICGAAYFREKDMPIVLNWITPDLRQRNLDAARAAIAKADTVVALVRAGGGGMPSFGIELNLPFQDMDMLLDIQREAKALGKKLVAVTYGGTPYATGAWVENCDALVCAFHPGQGGAAALAALLSGQKNFSGKLCMTFPKRQEDTCLTCSEDIIKERVGHQEKPRAPFTSHYTEGLNFGYRWNAETGVEPGFAFGYGLSYTTYKYGDFRVERTADGLDISLTVTNMGDMPGDEIVEVYLGRANVPKYARSPKKQLAAFLRVEEILPGETRDVRLCVKERELCYWDVQAPLTARSDGTKDKWVLAKGPRDVMIGASSDDIRYTVSIEI